MDLSRQLKNAIATGNLLFGQRQANDACAKGEAKLVLLLPTAQKNILTLCVQITLK